ncbi:hypothetical protein B0T22DRAFT_482008 [Podospora appendiculata]|uniref:SMP-30/Gluconolactonase/LRE-like region domain-containing protein n=1 Tax=Podospora appendiculata TaxID=314037 RepID=A0AAE1CA05_9PEZI|nr:hypothetical protein B0T22DRAFT_482008 [Podospora appendiculata]
MQKVLSAILSLVYSTTLQSQPANITIGHPGTPFAPSPLPLPGPSSRGDEIVARFTELSRSTEWELVDSIKFEGDTFEPEGLVRIGDDRYFVSAGEYLLPTSKYNATVNGTDRSAGAGFGHMIVFDGKGSRIADATVTEAGSVEYHNGGLDFDGEYIWTTFAQYRPNSTATLVRMRPGALEPEPVLHIADHMGAVVRDPATGNIVTLNWGARSASLWNLKDINRSSESPPAFAAPRAVVRNPSHYIDYQDCKFLGHPRRFGSRAVMLCSGITAMFGTTIGGIALVDMETMTPLYEVPLTMVSAAGNLVTKNPMDVAVVDGKMRFFFLPDERNSTLYVYEAASWA